MAVVKNLMVRVGADLSPLTGELARASGRLRDLGAEGKASSEEVAKGLENVKRAMEGTASNKGIIQLRDQIAELEAQQKSLQALGFDWGYKQFEDNALRLRELKGALQEYIDAFNAPEPTDGPREWVSQLRQGLDGANEKVTAFTDGLIASVDASMPLGARLEQARDALNQMKNAGLGLGDSGYDQMYQIVQGLTAEAREYQRTLSNPEPEQRKIGPIQQLRNAIREAGGAGEVLRGALGGIWSGVRTGAGLAARGVRTVGSVALSAARGGVNALRSGLGAIGRGTISGIRRVASGIRNIFTHSRSARSGVSGLASSIKSVGAVAIGLKIASAAMGRFRSLVRNAISDNAQLSAQVDQLKSGMSQALAPAIGLVTNALSVLMPYIVGVSNAFGSLIGNLFGTGWSSVATGASNAAAATESATAAQKEYNRQVLGFDEITKLDSSSGSSGGGSGGGGGGSTDVSTTPITGKLPGWLTDLTSQIKSAIDEGDWEGVGSVLATNLGSAVDKAREKINDVHFRAKVSTLVGHVTDTINGFFGTLTDEDGSKTSIAENIGGLIGDAATLAMNSIHQFLRDVKWSNIGTAVGQAINGALGSLTENDVNLGTIIGDLFAAGVKTAEAAVNKIKWSTLGTYVSTNVKSALGKIQDTIDDTNWTGMGAAIVSGINGLMTGLNDEDINLGTTLASVINAAFSAMSGAITTADWKGWGKTVATNINGFLTKTDFKAIGTTLSDGIKGALSTMSTAIKDIDWQQLGTDIKGFIEGIDWEGIVSGLADTMGSLAGGLVTALWTAFGDQITNFGDYFEGKIDEAGGDVIAGILNGITEGLVNIGTWIKDNIFTPFLNGFKSTFSIQSPSTDPQITGLGTNIIKGVFSGITDWLGGIGTWVKTNIFNPFKDAVAGVFGENSIDVTPEINLNGNGGVTISEESKSKMLATAKGVLQRAIESSTPVVAVKTAIGALEVVEEQTGVAVSPSTIAAKVKQYVWDPIASAVQKAFTAPIEAAVKIRAFFQGADGSTVDEDGFGGSSGGTASGILGRIQVGIDGILDHVEDKVPTGEKKVGDFKAGITKTDDTGIKTREIGGMKGLLTSATDKIQDKDKSISTKANFTTRSWKSLDRTIPTKANFTTKATASLDRTIPTKADFTTRSIKSLNATIPSKASFSSYDNAFKSTPWAYAKSFFSSYDNAFSSTPWAYAKSYFSNYNSSDLQKYYSPWAWAYGTLYFSGYSGGGDGGKIHFLGGGGIWTGTGWQNIARYASGVTSAPMGQLFIAREAGPELVGTLGGHTAVMNNNQIVASVSAGVAKAIAGIRFRISGGSRSAAMNPMSGISDIADRIAERMARALRTGPTGTDGNNRPIIVQMVMDGKVIGEKSVDYITGEARRGNYVLEGAV